MSLLVCIRPEDLRPTILFMRLPGIEIATLALKSIITPIKIYASAYYILRSYVLSIPLITADSSGNKASTMHHVDLDSWHKDAFSQQRSFIAEMLVGNVTLPAFAKPACTRTARVED